MKIKPTENNIDDMADMLGQSEILEPDAKKRRSSARKKRTKDIDGSAMQIAANPNDTDSFLSGSNGQIYPPQKLKELYAGRWGIETSFRDLKYTLGMLHYHSKKVMCIQQEIYAHLIMYNFSEMTTPHIVIKQKQRKHTYKANFSVAVHMCRLFYHRKITSPVLEAIISQNVIPVRPGRHRVRKNSDKTFKGFLYRIA